MSDQDNITEPDGQETEPTPCMPCRGTGKVVSNLGGTPKSVDCPWCAGSGMRIPGRDAQSPWLGAAEGGGEEPNSEVQG
jgi:DnaJ-class molecular chaperone